MQSTAFMPHHLPFIDFVLQPNIINNNNNNNNNNKSQYCSSSITTTNVHYDPNNMMILSSNIAAIPNSDHHLPAAAAPAVGFQPHFHVDHNDHHMNNSSSSAAGRLMFMDVVTTKNEEEYPININVGQYSIKSVIDQKAATVMADKRKRRSAGYHISYKERKEFGETKKAKGLIYEGRHDQAEGQADDHEDPPKEYIHVRARRGQATDSHSLAERVRREKISERMRMLQELVPGCDKVTGKALMLDEIINYVQSLQNQVEFLSMKLASVNPVVYNFNMDLEDYMNFKPDHHHQGQMPAQFPAALQDASLLFTNALQSDDQSTIVEFFSTQDAMTNTSYNKSTANSSHSTVLPPTLLSMESGCNDWTAGDINQKQIKFLDQAHVLKRMGYF